MEIRLEGTRLSWPAGERRVGSEDEALFRDCARRYRAAIRRGSAASLLLPIGRQLRAWLDGNSPWFEAALRASEAGIVAFAVSEQPPALEGAFIDVPWELLADGRGFLAEDAARPFEVVRRLGCAAPPTPPSDHQLSLLFMAGAPRGGEERELDYEAEEVGILDATTGLGLDFWVEESGNIGLLAREVRRRQPLDVLHLSCHGMGGATPALALEDEGGALEWVSADSLAEHLGSTLPKLLFMSACHTAERHQVAGSLATRLVQRGIPSVLGWDGAVGDHEASAFANVLYRGLSARRPLEQAVRAARLALLQAQTRDKPSRDWHLARLYLGPAGGGPLAGGTRPRQGFGVASSIAYLDEDRQVPVAGLNLFVGRRRQVQEVLRELRGGTHAGVVVHGFGQQGKSSLALRVAQRLTPDYAIAPVVGRCDALAVLAALKQACKARGVEERIDEAQARVRKHPDALRPLLTELLDGPLSALEVGSDGTLQRQPVLLILDNLEDVLAPEAGAYVVKDHPLAVGLAAVVEAFAVTTGVSRLLITSRHPFVLDVYGKDLGERLHRVPLPPMSEIECRKQVLALLRARGADGLSGPAGMPGECFRYGRGVPGLQAVVLNLCLAPPEVRDKGLAQIAQQVRGWQPPGASEDVTAFFARVAIDGLLSVVDDRDRGLLPAMGLFDVPVPAVVVERLETTVNTLGARERLARIGVLDQHADLFDSNLAAFAVHPLVAPRFARSSDEERRALARASVEVLFAAWGSDPGRARRPYACGLQLARLAVHAGGPIEVLNSAAHDAVHGLGARFESPMAARLGLEALGSYEEQQAVPSLEVLTVVAEQCVAVGETYRAKELYDQATRVVDKGPSVGATVSSMDRARLLLSHARLLQQFGEVDKALRQLESARHVFPDDARRERAVVLGDIARIRLHRGDVEAALALHEERLREFDALGARHDRAATLGDISRIRLQKGDVEAALALHEEELREYDALGARRHRAVTLGDIARIRLQEGDVETALALHQEQLREFDALGARRERAVTLGDIARIRLQKGDVEDALALYKEQLREFDALGARRERAVTLGDIARIRLQKGDVEAALALYKEQLREFDALGARLERAVTLGDIAHIRLQKGDVEAALALYEERLRELDALSARLERAVTLGDIARIRLQKGEVEAALALHEERLRELNALGARLELAVTLGDIARIRLQEGEVEVALALHEEMLREFDALGARRERAVTLGDIARIRLQKGDVEAGLALHQEQLREFEALGDRRERAVTLGDIAHIRLQEGEVEAALALHEEELREYEALGDRRDRAVALGDIARIRLRDGDIEAGLALHQEQLREFEALGDRRERAVTLGDIARIRLQNGEVEAALALHEEELREYDALGARRERAVALGDIARIHLHKGNAEAALALLEAMLREFDALGDLDGRAHTLWSLARLDLRQGRFEQGVQRFAESYRINTDLQNLEGFSFVGLDLGRALLSASLAEQARPVLETSLRGFQVLGMTDKAAEVEQLLAQLPPGPPDNA